MSDRLLPLLARLAHRTDLVIAILVLVAVVMMLVPLPTGLVDVLIATNIAISVLILLAALYISQPLDFSSLPSVILTATLFRLAITITTTRLILLQADAGHIVTAFGTFVVGGSLIVGLVVFLIITIAQFVVIAKGAERVAEVAARFTLDALPGKQMSIDAELRNGDIDQAEARRLRRQLERESQLFGAMDGAMKFVKGDVIAGIIIILVNLIGGFAIGTLQHGMSLGEAAARYSLLTVGDGLVAQIPALMISVASGTTITRVAGVDGPGNLGSEIVGQLLRDARVLTLAAMILTGLALVPGFPTPVFLIIGATLAVAAYGLNRNVKRGREQEEGSESGSSASEAAESLPRGPAAIGGPAQRVLLRVGPELAGALPAPELRQRIEKVRNDLRQDLGVEVPPIAAFVDDDLDPQRLRIDLEGAPIWDRDIPPGSVLVEGDAAHLNLIGLPSEEGASDLGRHKAVWVAADHTPALRKAGLRFLSPVDVAGTWIEQALRLYAGHFVGIQETRTLLGELEAEYADLVKEVRESVPLPRIAEVLRRLVAEDVPIRNLRLILEALIEWGQREQDAALLTEQVRIALKRQISFRVAGRDHLIAAYLLQPSLEETLRSAVRATGSGAVLSLSDDEAGSITRQIEQALAGTDTAARPVVLTAADIRRHVRSLLVHSGIQLQVMSYLEVSPEFSVQPLTTITRLNDGLGDWSSSQALPSARGAAEHPAAS